MRRGTGYGTAPGAARQQVHGGSAGEQTSTEADLAWVVHVPWRSAGRQAPDGHTVPARVLARVPAWPDRAGTVSSGP